MSASHETVGAVSAADITSQTIGWQAALDAVRQQRESLQALWSSRRPTHIVITACGSPVFLASSAAILLADFGKAGVPITVVPADELRRAPLLSAPAPKDTLLLVITRSGSTSEVLEAVEAFRHIGGRNVWAITCRSKSRIVEVADIDISFDDGFEQSVAQTRSFSSMLVAVQAIAAVLGGHDLSEADALPKVGLEMLAIAANKVDTIDLSPATTRIDFVGSQEFFGLAREAMLKMTEMALTNSAAYHILEYRHGPISLTDEHSVLIGLITESEKIREHLVLSDIEGLGGQTVAIDTTWLPESHRTLPRWALPVLRMPALQLIAHRRAVLMGLDPDQPRHLSAVVHLEQETSEN